MDGGDGARAPGRIHGAFSFGGVGRASPPGRAGRSLAAVAGIVVALALAALFGLDAANPAGAATQTFVVNDSRDLVDARVGANGCRTMAGTCTLRAAIQEANATPDPDRIELPGDVGVYAITIRGNGNTQGDFDVTRPLTINGAGATSTIIDAGEPPSGAPPDRRGLDRVFEIQSGAGNVTFAGVTIREGYSAEMGGGIQHASTGTLRLENVVVRDSFAGKYGGGVNNVGGGRVQLIGSAFFGNAAVEGGSALNNAASGTIEILAGSEVSNNPGTYPLLAGAINNEAQNNAIGAIVVSESLVLRNQAIRNGAGISNGGDGSILVERSSISGNLTSGSGGGIYAVSGDVRVIDHSTISDNQAGNDISTGDGGGIYSVGQVTKAGVPGRLEISDATISGNRATGDGGGITGGLDADVTLTASIVSDNEAGSDGGGVSAQSRARMAITRVDFLGNIAAVRAGGVYAYSSGALTIEDARFSMNEAREEGGGGLYTDGSGTISVVASEFSENKGGGDGGGVAIHSSGAVTIADSILEHNHSLAGGGGGLENSGALVSLTRITVSGNTAFLDGGGIRSTASGEFTILDSAVEGNSAENGGGFAAVADSTLVVRRSLFSGNTARFSSNDPLAEPRSDTGLGGGIYSIADGDSLFENTTVSGNTAATAAGGVYNDADAVVRLVNVTISHNTAPRGAGFALEVAAPPSSLVILRNTIVAANDGADCDGGLTSEGGNIDGGTSCQFQGPGDLSNTNPDLAPLDNYGGPTKTHALNPGSAAVDAGVEPCLLTDQRGFARPRVACDVGAYELGTDVSAPTECAGGTVTVNADADSWVLQSSATNNYGSDTVLKVDSKSGGNARALVRFALAPSIPSGCDVVEAVLRLYASSHKEGRTLEALPLTETWSEALVTWDSQPEPDDEGAVTALSGSGYVEWTVTSPVQEMHSGANNGFLIRDESEDGGGVDQGFHSREKGVDNPPQLVVTFG